MIGLLVTEANAPEWLVAAFLVDEYKQRLTHLRVIWVDQGYSGPKFARAIQQLLGEHVQVEVIQRSSSQFEPLPKRWIVERTFGWLNRFRRLSKDYELHCEVSEAMIFTSLLRILFQRLA